MRLGTPPSPNDKSKRRKPPPDYSSRRVQFRLFVLVTLVMVVITAAFEARNPARWRWLWELNGTSKDAGESLDPRLHVAPGRESESGEVVLSDSRSPRGEQTSAERKRVPAEVRAWEAGWDDVYKNLSYDDRTVLYNLLNAARRTGLSDDSAHAAETLERLDQCWSDHRRLALAALSDLSETEQQAWSELIEGLYRRWHEAVRPALASVGEAGRSGGVSLSDAQRAQLQELQSLLNSVQLNMIQDDSVFRSSEREIWFYLLGELQAANAAQLQEHSLGPIGYAALFKQPDFYRGKLVTVQGTAKAVYSLPAPQNSYGIERYWVYVLYPSGGPSNPILVYALEKPADFPSLERADVGKKPLASEEEVRFTGYFFKRYAYQAQGGIFTAPMLLAREPEWLPASSLLSNRPLPSLPAFLGVAAVLALLAAALAWWVYHQDPVGSSRPRADRVEMFSDKTGS
jgi:hypothetical protein